MILIADAGSTKTAWSLLTRSGQTQDFQTEGINPFFQSENQIYDVVSNCLLPQTAKLLWAGPVTHVFFYGAGCTPEKSPMVANALQKVFKKAEIQVDSDMTGAAIALFGNETGVACILGTGSNTCLWRNGRIQWQVPSLGFILGDEGSGGALGKRLVADLLKNQLGNGLKNKFLKDCNLTQADIIERVYRQPLPNRFLASLSRFCADNIAEPAVRELVVRHFTEFADRILLQYVHLFETPESGDAGSPSVPHFGFTGSVAFYYEDILREVLAGKNLTVSKILKDPLPEMKKHFLNEFYR